MLVWYLDNNLLLNSITQEQANLQYEISLIYAPAGQIEVLKNTPVVI